MKLSSPAANFAGLALGGAFVGLGLFFGLRQRPVGGGALSAGDQGGGISATVASEQARDAASTSASPKPATLGVLGTPAAPVLVGAPPASRASGDAVEQVLEQFRPLLRTQCWEPSVAKSAGSTRVTLTFHLTFDASGTQIARWIEDDADAGRNDVTACAAKVLPKLHIAGGGGATRATVGFSLP